MFRPALLPLVAVVLGCVVLLTLGTWQMQRLAWKLDLITTMEQRKSIYALPLPELITPEESHQWQFAPVTVTGRFVGPYLRMPAGIREGRMGESIWRVLQRRNMSVLVNLGWRAVDEPRSFPQGLFEGGYNTEGIVAVPARPNVFTPENRPDEGLYHWLDMDDIAQRAGVSSLAPVVIYDSRSKSHVGLYALEPPVDLKNNHLGYALTWYGLAIALGVMFVAGSMKKQES